MKQYLSNIKKALFTATIVLVVSAKGNAKISNDTTWHHLPYAKNPTINHSGDEIANAIESGNDNFFNMTVDEFVIQKTNMINIYREHDKWKDAQGNLVTAYKASRQFIASMYRNASLQIASWQSDQALVFRLTTGSIGKGKNEKVVIKYFDYWTRNPYQNEGMFVISPSALADVVGNYPDINLGSNQCLNDIVIKQIQIQQQQLITQAPAPCTTCNQQIVYQQQPQQRPCNNCQQVNCQNTCITSFMGTPYRVPAIYTDEFRNPYNGYVQGCGTCGQIGCGGGCYGRGINPYPYIIAGKLIDAGTMFGVAYFSQPQQTIYVQNYTTATASGGTAQTWVPRANNGSGITITPGGSTTVLNGGQGNGNAGTGTSGVILNGGQGNGAGGFINNNNGQGFGNGGLNGGGSSWQGTGFSIPSQWTR